MIDVHGSGCAPMYIHIWAVTDHNLPIAFSIMHHLNLDLVSEILSFVTDDSTLRSSALVHRSWTTYSQALLFHTTHIGASGPSSNHKWPKPWVFLLILLENTPHLRPYIRILDFLLETDHDDWRRDTHVGSTLFPNVHTARFIATPLWDLVEKLPQLKSLCAACTTDVRPLHEDRLKLEILELNLPVDQPRLPAWLHRSTSLRGSLRKLSLSVEFGDPWRVVSGPTNINNISLPWLEHLEVTFKFACACGSNSAAQLLMEPFTHHPLSNAGFRTQTPTSIATIVESMLISSKLHLLQTLHVSALKIQRDFEENGPYEMSTLTNMDNAVVRDASRQPLIIVLAVPSHLKDSPELDLDHWSRLWLQACRKNKVDPRDAGQSLHPEKA
jgi:hypothetical protein